MSGIYTVEDLLRLRASPLIAKPPNLPPIEEWMGTQDVNTKRPTTRGRGEEGINQSEGFQKRPVLSDVQQRRSTTDPDRIVLGPPRRSFASSNARGLGRNNIQDGAEDLPIHERKKTGDLESRDEGTQNEKSRRRQDDDDTESTYRRDPDHNRPRWGPRERDSVQEIDAENGEALNGRGKRDTQGRSRFEQPWFRSEKGGEETKKEGDRQDWRSGGKERHWGRNERVEEEPEWLDAAEPADEPQARTAEDFQRWKERMKAGTTGAVTEKSEPVAMAPVEEKHASRSPLPHLVPSAEMGDAMDKFFARFNPEKGAAEEKPASKPAVKTRFASLFGPSSEPSLKFEVAPAAPEQPVSATRSPAPPTEMPSSAEADQAGFARILEMLKSRNNNPSPQTQEPKPRVPLYARDGHSGTREELRSPVGPPAALSEHPEPSVSAPIDRRSPIDPAHTRQQSSLSKDEILLNLLRQSNLSAQQRNSEVPHQLEQRHPPGIFSMPDNLNRIEPPQQIHPHRRETAKSPYDTIASTRHYVDEPPQQELPQQRAANGGYNFFDVPQGEYPAQRRAQPQSREPTLPPGLQRPPGFEQSPITGAPPGWPITHQQPPPNPIRQVPPPGLANLPPGMRPFNGSANPLQQHPQPQQRQPQRKYTGETPQALPFPPGMQPPPGYANGGPPPPPPGLYGRYAEPQNAQRGFLEMMRGSGNAPGMRGYR